MMRIVKRREWVKELALTVPGIAEADCYVYLAEMVGFEPTNTRVKV